MQPIEPHPPEPVRTAVMLQRWDRLTFLHWQYPPADILPHIPKGLELDLWEGRAWVSLTPFLLKNLRPPWLPSLPWISKFPETNLRTYVQNRRGERGIWFFSLEAGRLPAVLGARATYGLPYMWSRMSVSQQREMLTYKGSRMWPGPRGAGYDIRMKIGDLIAPSEIRELDHFLTARFRLYTRFAGRIGYAKVEHPPWPLARVNLLGLTQTLTAAAGLPSPSEEPMVQFSPGVNTRIGRLHVGGGFTG